MSLQQEYLIRELLISTASGNQDNFQGLSSNIERVIQEFSNNRPRYQTDYVNHMDANYMLQYKLFLDETEQNVYIGKYQYAYTSVLLSDVKKISKQEFSQIISPDIDLSYGVFYEMHSKQEINYFGEEVFIYMLLSGDTNDVLSRSVQIFVNLQTLFSTGSVTSNTPNVVTNEQEILALGNTKLYTFKVNRNRRVDITDYTNSDVRLFDDVVAVRDIRIREDFHLNTSIGVLNSIYGNASGHYFIKTSVSQNLTPVPNELNRFIQALLYNAQDNFDIIAPNNQIQPIPITFKQTMSGFTF